ncbi:MAG: class I SAM-dependent methyltransferase [Thermoplasmata archaeon]|nr:MAG: class I SAM-dependent methyltransferase [Thermoplasmata archaeon]
MLYEMEKEGRNLLLKLLEKHHGNKMLEVGCGSNELALLISKKFNSNVKCIDPYGYGKNIIKMRGEEIAKLNEKFDVIYSVMSLHHMDAFIFLKEAIKALNNNGKLIIVDWKKGVETGVPEYYFSLNEVIAMMKDYEIIDKGEKKHHFYVVGKENKK